MARKTDTDIEWRAKRLHAALRTHVDDEGRLDGTALASLHLNSSDPRTGALAKVVFLASTYDIDANNAGYRLRMEMAQSTRALAQSVRSWVGQMDPIVEYNLRRIRELGENARVFAAHEIPERVASIRGVVGALQELAELLARQLYHPDAVPRRAGKPVDFVLNEITHTLKDAGFSVREIATLTDRQGGDAAKRVRNRLKASRQGRGQGQGPVARKAPVPRRQRTAAPRKRRS